MTAPPLAVLVVDDSHVLRTVVSHYLDDETDLHVIASVGSAGEAVEQARRLGPDIILLDHDMPDRTGLDVLPELRACSPAARIVVFSAAPDIRQDALRRGADEFVGKDSPFHEVADVLRVRSSALAGAGERVGEDLREPGVPAGARVQAVQAADEVLR